MLRDESQELGCVPPGNDKNKRVKDRDQEQVIFLVLIPYFDKPTPPVTRAICLPVVSLAASRACSLRELPENLALTCQDF